MFFNPVLSGTKLAPIGNNDQQVQPNGVDLRLAKVFRPHGDVTLNGEEKSHAFWREEPVGLDGLFHLGEGSYQIEFVERVQMSPYELGWCFGRSTLMRNGIQIVSCLYDSGYTGKMVAMMVVPKGVALHLPKCERVAQFVVAQCQPVGKYAGSYQEQSLNAEE